MKPTHSIEAYIQAVQNNIRWKRARKIATQDLEQHIQDQFDAYVNQGMDSDPALEEAIKSMGDPQKIGKELDCAYRPKINILLIELTTAFLVLGVIIHYLLEGTLSKNNFIAIGIGCFAAVALYFFDYTFLLRHPLAIYTVHLFFSAFLFAFEARNGIHCICSISVVALAAEQDIVTNQDSMNEIIAEINSEYGTNIHILSKEELKKYGLPENTNDNEVNFDSNSFEKELRYIAEVEIPEYDGITKESISGLQSKESTLNYFNTEENTTNISINSASPVTAKKAIIMLLQVQKHI